MPQNVNFSNEINYRPLVIVKNELTICFYNNFISWLAKKQNHELMVELVEFIEFYFLVKKPSIALTF